jgi:two-component system nitrogen regulation response regulator NtrX
MNVIPLEVPPLRERGDDVEQLASYFLKQISGRTGGGMKRWEQGALKVMRMYDWPGNVRELKNLVERLVIMSSGSTIDEKDVASVLPSTVLKEPSKPEIRRADEYFSFREMIERFEKDILLEGFRETEGNVSKLARKLKMDRANLHRKLKTYGIK